jgi:serine/threonine-protein kinase
MVVIEVGLSPPNTDLLLRRGDTGEVELEDFLTADWDEGNASVSPDGRWIAYQSDETGEDRIYVHSFPTITGRRSISPGLGVAPIWSPDGRELYYRSGSRLMAVDIVTDPTFEVSVPELLFDEVAYYQGGGGRDWDVHPDGLRFLMVRQGAGGAGGDAAASGSADVYLVTNWFTELRERMGEN